MLTSIVTLKVRSFRPIPFECVVKIGVWWERLDSPGRAPLFLYDIISRFLRQVFWQLIFLYNNSLLFFFSTRDLIRITHRISPLPISNPAVSYGARTPFHVPGVSLIRYARSFAHRNVSLWYFLIRTTLCFDNVLHQPYSSRANDEATYASRY